MKKRPLAVTFVGWLYIVAGAVQTALLLPELHLLHPLQNGAPWIGLVRLSAVLFGFYMLRGRNWARWLAVVWMGGHLILAAFASTQMLVVHGLMFTAIAYLLFRADSRAYFRATRAAAH